MAIRQKTIEYTFDTVATPISNMTGYTSSVMPIYIPETGSRVFKSCWMKTYMRDSNAATTGRGSLQRALSKLLFNGVESSTKFINQHSAFLDTGEQQIITFSDDYTSEFNTNFTGSVISMSNTLWYSASNSSPGFVNLTRKLYITYDFDDTNATTRVKTVKIPLEYYTASMGIVHSPMPNSNFPQIPALDTFCPESNKVFRDIWLEFSGVERDTTTGTISSYLSASLDGTTPTTIGYFEQANISNIPFRITYDLSSMDTSTTHSLWLSRTGSCNFIYCTPILHATYEYNHNNSTRILNSVQGAFTFPGFTAFGVNPFDVFSYTYPIVIPESNPTLKQSALVYHIGNTSGTPSMVLNIGSGSVKLGGFNVSINQMWGHCGLVMRFDTGSIYYPHTSSLPTFQRGKNYIHTAARVTAQPQRIAPPVTSVYLNYESDKHADGSEVHNKTIRRLQLSGSIFGTAGYMFAGPNLSPNLSNNIPEDDYFINYYGYYTATQRTTVAGRVMYNPIEPSASFGDFVDPTYDGNFCESYIEDGIPVCATISELSIINCPVPDQTKTFRCYPGQLTSSINPMEGILNPEITRSYILNPDSVRHSFSDVITYHSIAFPVTGTVSGYTGDGSGIDVILHDAITGKALKKTTTTTGGAYTMSWYDPTQLLYVESQQDSTHTGRSVNGSIV